MLKIIPEQLCVLKYGSFGTEFWLGYPEKNTCPVGRNKYNVYMSSELEATSGTVGQRILNLNCHKVIFYRFLTGILCFA